MVLFRKVMSLILCGKVSKVFKRLVVFRTFMLLNLIPMTTITLQVPDFLEADRQDTVRFIAAKLYESGKLTLGQAAQVAGMPKWEFAEILIKYDVHYLDQSASEDLEALS
jgi:predicted HTH domain antitoxin